MTLPKLSLPTESCYQESNYGEFDRAHGFPDVTLWIPENELKRLVAEGKIVASALENYPLGLEVALSEEEFGEHELVLSFKPDELRRRYLELLEAGKLPKEKEGGRHIVSARALERSCKSKALPKKPLPPPRYSKGVTFREFMTGMGG